jgi:hypothetical protein
MFLLNDPFFFGPRVNLPQNRGQAPVARITKQAIGAVAIAEKTRALLLLLFKRLNHANCLILKVEVSGHDQWPPRKARQSGSGVEAKHPNIRRVNTRIG